MKLSRLYTNDDSVFIPIDFRDGLNAIVARIQHPTDDDKSSHCLGKTLIIDVIDFCLLKTVGKKGHFLKTRDDLFGDLIFFLEIELGKGDFVTVRREVREATKIAFVRHQERHRNFNNMPDDKWDHAGVSLSASVRMLDGYLELTAIKPWSYRKGFSYFLRRQEDYSNEFQLRKFMSGKHKDWKPYVARVLGFDETEIIEKYEADADESAIISQRDEAQSDVTVKVSDYEKLQARILAKGDEVTKKVSALDRFDFNAQEMGLNQELADDIEGRIAELNDSIYNAKFDLAQVRKGLETKVDFNLDDVQRIFKEAELTFPDQLAKDYSELVDFNKRIHQERRAGLMKRATELEATLISFGNEMSSLSAKRMEILEILGGTDSLEKFKGLQKELDRDRTSLALMEEKSAKLDAIKAFDNRLRKAKERKEQLTVQIGDLIKNGSDRYKEIQRVFTRIIKEVLHRTAVLYVKQNDSGNIDFHAEYTDSESDEETQERQGTSFRKLLCIAFDLSVLISYSEDRFFHFVYQDGALEQLESKRKLALLSCVRAACTEHGIQYIFSAIEEELPTADDLENLCPNPDEIVLELNDSGEDGRLFKVETF
ncbi:MAG: DUF2326 domain-containing protein [Candidatus Marinimicrobia bacterium]|nr:DUF2326 domain-containing protein [Candidatus Neomarinimicrobiota bacterium]MCF7904284.1 DUF2326 domain-containing protein [Candidatus Neomarinimicrobiota bacterium]